MDTTFDTSLKMASKKHDVTAIRITDPAETALPDVGLMTIRDPETGQVTVINTRNRALRDQWRVERSTHDAYVTELFKRAGVDQVEIRTDGSVVEPLTRLFDMRKHRL